MIVNVVQDCAGMRGRKSADGIRTVMPFLDSPTIRPLYDVMDGGPPRGYVCQLRKNEGPNIDYSIECNRVTRTLRGMIAHQRIVHGIRQQQEFNFEEVRPTE